MMSFRQKLLIPPLLLLLLAFALMAFSGHRILHISTENEQLREFNLAVADAEAAQAALARLDGLVGQLLTPAGKDVDELYFRYLDVYRDFTQRLGSPHLQSRLGDGTRRALDGLAQELTYKERMDAPAAALAIGVGTPVLDQARRDLWVRKRDMYEHYYDSVQTYTAQLSRLYIAFGLAGLLLGVPLVLWAARSLELRVRDLRDRASALSGAAVSSEADPLVGLDQALSAVDQRLEHSGGGGQLVRAVDDERRRIALDMHDEVLSGITGLVRQADGLRDVAPDAARRLRSDLEHLSGDIRRVIDDLHPPVLETLGWEAALRAHLARLAELPGTPEVLLNIEPRCADGLDDARRASVYRILREVVNNVLRHARASRLEIDCRAGERGLEVVVDDNGDGALPLREGRGISGIRYRAASLGGQANWLPSRFSSGVRFVLDLPQVQYA